MPRNFLKLVRQNEKIRLVFLIFTILLILFALYIFVQFGGKSTVIVVTGAIMLGISFVFITYLEYFLNISSDFVGILFALSTVLATIIIYLIFSTVLFPNAGLELRLPIGLVIHHFIVKLFLKIFKKSLNDHLLKQVGLDINVND
jgi:hypothetical protein